MGTVDANDAAPSQTLSPLMVGLAALWLSGGCLETNFAELGKAACQDDADQDGDGLVDCEDLDCASSGVCEHLASTCSDLRDNDGDGRTDCQDPSCHGLEPCFAFAADCSPAVKTDCPHELACYVRPDRARECRAPGSAAQRDACAEADPMSQAEPHGCAAGLGCEQPELAMGGLCSPYCSHDKDCPYGSQCVGANGDLPGLCTAPCDPLASEGAGAEARCPPSFVCLAGQAIGISRAEGGYRYRCVEAQAFPIEDVISNDTTPCSDPSSDGVPEAGTCAPGRLCWGVRAVEQRCRSVCYADEATSTCKGEERCVAVTPPGSTPVGAEGRAFGVCVP